MQLDSPVLKSHLKRRLSLLEFPLSLPARVDILVGRGLPNLDFTEIGFCFLATTLAGLVVLLVVLLVVGRVVGRVVGLVVGLAVVVVVGRVLVVLLVKTGAVAGVVLDGCFLCGARGTTGLLAREELEAAGTVKVK